MPAPEVSIVVIGRNEGARLTACLESVRAAKNFAASTELIYVDSNSSDGSDERARALGAQVIVLTSGKLSAARARNAGWRAASAPFILFLDGDTILHAEFLNRALAEFKDPQVAVVCGNRRETRPQDSIYNRILDLDWISPPGFTDFCGGDAVIRRSVLEEVDGYNVDLIAGEEPDMCRRMRASGHLILHIDCPMTGHDLAILRFSQYWRRAVRTGHAYAEIAARYRKTTDALWSKESRANLFRGSLYLFACFATCIAAILLRSWIPIVVAVLAFSVLAVRTAVCWRWKSSSWSTLLLFGFHSHFQHIPVFQGQLLFFWGRFRRQDSELIEYKTNS